MDRSATRSDRTPHRAGVMLTTKRPEFPTPYLAPLCPLHRVLDGIGFRESPSDGDASLRGVGRRLFDRHRTHREDRGPAHLDAVSRNNERAGQQEEVAAPCDSHWRGRSDGDARLVTYSQAESTRVGRGDRVVALQPHRQSTSGREVALVCLAGVDPQRICGDHDEYRLSLPAAVRRRYRRLSGRPSVDHSQGIHADYFRLSGGPGRLKRHNRRAPRAQVRHRNARTFLSDQQRTGTRHLDRKDIRRSRRTAAGRRRRHGTVVFACGQAERRYNSREDKCETAAAMPCYFFAYQVPRLNSIEVPLSSFAKSCSPRSGLSRLTPSFSLAVALTARDAKSWS